MAKPKKEKQDELGVIKKEITVLPDKAKAHSIVGIGGSAGSFPSFEKFFTQMPSNSGLSFVIIMHLDPHYRSHLVEVFQRFTSMPVIEATDGIVLEQNRVYLIPPNKDMGIHNGQLLLLLPSKSNGLRQPIDYFLQSLAEDQGSRSIGIIFSGMGSDGETGMRMIKEKLGVTMVQDPTTAEYDSMPNAAIAINLIDFILAPEEMPAKLIQFINHPALAEENSEQNKLTLQADNAVQKILMLLRSYTGHDFSQYKMSTIMRRIDRRLAYYQLKNYANYVDLLKEDPAEIEQLFNELLIGVTKFFRDSQAFDVLKSKFSQLILQKNDQDPIRVWIAGCSTGEEAYSIAMILVECLEAQKGRSPSKLQIFATDLDAEALEHARAGLYRGNIVADVSHERIEKFFVKIGEDYAIKKNLREMIVFAQQNLIKDAPFIRLDLVCCRNMLIYFSAELQKKIIPLFYYALNPEGLMFLGPAETVGGFIDFFKAIDPKWKLFERREGNVLMSRLVDFPFNVATVPIEAAKRDKTPDTLNQRSAGEIFNKLLIEQFSPAAVLVNEKGDILFSNGKTGKFLSLPSGQATMNIHKMVREELQYAMGSCISLAMSEAGSGAVHGIRLKEDKKYHLVNLKASKIKENGMEGLILLVFEDQGSVTNKRAANKTGLRDESPLAEELAKELVYTKQRLYSTIEQMESSLEELKSTNEELQSTNEELQSTNEESLTTKEEMQSLNEELMTINMQYQSKTDELTRLNNDMKNLLDATEIGAIFLDNNLGILRYTPQVRKLFNLIPTDIGRPITHVVSNFEQPFNEEVILEVIDKLTIKEIDVNTKKNDWYRVRIMPYRTLDNFISGAVLTFTMITDFKLMQSRLEVLQAYSDNLTSTSSSAVCQLDKVLLIRHFNAAFAEIFNIKLKDIEGSSLADFLKERWQTTEPGELLMQCLSTKADQLGFINEYDGKQRKFKIKVALFSEDTNSTPLIIVTIDEQQEIN